MNLAQIAMTVMLSMVCAIPCSQAEFTLPPFENNLKLQGTGATGLCLGRAGRRLGGPRAFWRCSARATLLSRAVFVVVHCCDLRCDRMRPTGPFCTIVGFADAPVPNCATIRVPQCMNLLLEGAPPP